MQNSKKWSIIALASVVLVSVAYFASTGQMSGLRSSALVITESPVCQPEKFPFYPEYQKTLSELDVLISDIKTLKVKIKETQSSTEAAETEIQARTKQNASYQTQIAKVTKENKAICANPRLAAKCRQNRAQITKLQNDIKNNEKKITDFKKTKAYLEKSLKEYEQQYTKLDASRLDKIVQIEAFEKQIEEACKPPVVSGEVRYRMASWECHDESQARYKDVHSCTDVQTWKSFSDISCQKKCSKETGKCGVNRLAYDEKCDIQIPAVCGNGIREGSEQCDDGNKNDEDECTNSCTTSLCSILGSNTPGCELNKEYVLAANKLANLGIIEDKSPNPDQYRFEALLIRYDAVRAAAKTLGGILENESSYTCVGLFTDIGKNHPMCATAELTRNAGFIPQTNVFRPNDNLTKFEGIVYALQSRGFKNLEIYSIQKILEFAVDLKMIETHEGFQHNNALTRGEFFYYLSQGLQTQQQPDICDVAPDLCGQ